MRWVSSIMATSGMLAALLVGASSSPAAVTLGSSLSATPDSTFSCGSDCTYFNATLGGGALLSAPYDGVLARWRVKGFSGSFALRVLRPTGTGAYTGVGTGPLQSVPSTGLETLALAQPLPVRAGDLIGYDATSSSTFRAAFFATGSTSGHFSPPLPDGATASPFTQQGELFFNADLVGFPSVSGVAPTSGDTAGGTSVTINGAHLADVSAVFFGGVPATRFSVLSDTQLSATAPARSPGTVDVQVTNPAGNSPAVSADRFTYVAPPGPYVNPTPVPKRPPSPPSHFTSPPRVTVGVVKGTRSGVQFKLSCKGRPGQFCVGSGRMTTRERLVGEKIVKVSSNKTKLGTRTVTVGQGTYRIAAGHSATVKISLNATGRRLVKKFRRFPVRVIVTLTGANGKSSVVFRSR